MWIYEKDSQIILVSKHAKNTHDKRADRKIYIKTNNNYWKSSITLHKRGQFSSLVFKCILVRAGSLKLPVCFFVYSDIRDIIVHFSTSCFRSFNRQYSSKRIWIAFKKHENIRQSQTNIGVTMLL